jgi:hypothetical protein
MAAAYWSQLVARLIEKDACHWLERFRDRGFVLFVFLSREVTH